MTMLSSRRVRRAALLLAAFLTWTVPAAAQVGAASAQPAVGDQYHIEAAASWWNPQPEVIVSSESLGIPGDQIDLVSDLGIEQKRIGELRFVLRPSTKHKF